MQNADVTIFREFLYERLVELEENIDEQMSDVHEDLLNVLNPDPEGGQMPVSMDISPNEEGILRISGYIDRYQYQFILGFSVLDEEFISVSVYSEDEDYEDDFSIPLIDPVYNFLRVHNLLVSDGGGDDYVIGASADMEVVDDEENLGHNDEGSDEMEVEVEVFINNAADLDGADDGMQGLDYGERFILQQFFYNSVIEEIQDNINQEADATQIARDFLSSIGPHNGVLPNIRFQIEDGNTIRINSIGDNHPHHNFIITVNNEYAYIGFELRYEHGGVEDVFEFSEEEDNNSGAFEILGEYIGMPEYNEDNEAENPMIMDEEPFVSGADGCSGFESG